MIGEPTDEEKQLYRQRDIGAKVKGMVNHPGWKEFVMPGLEKKKEIACNQLLNADIKNITEIYEWRLTVQAIDGLIKSVQTAIELGDAAVKILKERSEQKET